MGLFGTLWDSAVSFAGEQYAQHYYQSHPELSDQDDVYDDISGYMTPNGTFDEGDLTGFLTSVGEQNAMDREYNSDEAVKQRDWQSEMLQTQMDYNSAEAAANREWQSKESALSRSWQQAMSDTSFSRAVSDLRRAGLNPILAAQRLGASTGSGGMATGGSAASVAPTSGAAASYSGSRGVDFAQILSALGSFMSGAGKLINNFTPSKVFSTITKK